MYGYESWTIKKAWCQKINAFKLWCWGRFLRDLWTARRSNQLILKEINPEYSLKGLVLKLKRLYFGHLMQRANSPEKTLMLEKTEGRRRKGWQRMRYLDGIIDTMNMSLSKLHKGQGNLSCCSFWGQEEGMATHSSIFAWRMPWTEEPGGLQSLGSQSQTWLKQPFMHTILGASQVALVIKNPSASAGDLRTTGFIPGSGRSPGVGYANPLQSILQYSCLENPMDRGA